MTRRERLLARLKEFGPLMAADIPAYERPALMAAEKEGLISYDPRAGWSLTAKAKARFERRER
jgi:hypothetical protein